MGSILSHLVSLGFLQIYSLTDTSSQFIKIH